METEKLIGEINKLSPYALVSQLEKEGLEDKHAFISYIAAENMRRDIIKLIEKWKLKK